MSDGYADGVDDTDIGADLFRNDAQTQEDAKKRRNQGPYEGDNPDDLPYMGRAGFDNGLWTNVVKPTAAEVGGHRGGAAQEEKRYAAMAAAADNRLGAQVDNSQFYADRDLDSQSRFGQQSALNNYQTALGAYGDAMNGVGTSVAQQQLSMGMNQGLAQQASMAMGAHGGGANLAAAQRAAALGGAQLAGQTNQQAAMLRANEISQARAGYLGAAQGLSGAYGQMRGQDQSRGGMAAQNAQYQAGLNQQQHGLNDARNLSYEGMRQRTMEDQTAAQQWGEAANNGVYQANQNRKQSADEAAAARTDKYIGAAAATGGAMLAASDRNLKKEIQPGANSLSDALREMRPYEYEYKDPSLGEGARLGIMAQDLERSSMGKQIVVNTPEGKAIDVKKGLSFALAGLAELDKRVRAGGKR